MNPQLAWYAARAAGIVAWALLSAAVIWGLLLSTRLLHGTPTPRWLLDLHRFLGGLAVTFTAVHIGGLVGDNYLHFGTADLLVPFASNWRPGAVALGVVGLWLLLAVELTSLLMRWLPHRLWHRIHMSSYVLFWTATLHGLLAGTDAHNVVYIMATNSVVTLVLFLTLVRALASPRRARSAKARPAGTTRTRARPPVATASARSRADTDALPAVSALPANLPQPRGRAPATPFRDHTLEWRTGPVLAPQQAVGAPPGRSGAPPRPARPERTPEEHDALARRAQALAARRQPTPQQRQALAAQRAAARSARTQTRPEAHPARRPRPDPTV